MSGDGGGWKNHAANFQAHLKARLVNYAVNRRQNANTVFKLGRILRPKPRLYDAALVSLVARCGDLIVGFRMRSLGCYHVQRSE
jgi:hypothetical protein